MLYYHKNIPNTECPNRNVKNILIWLGVLDEQSAAVVSEDGILNSAGLKNWCHNGYIDPATKKRIYEKDLLEQFYISGDFWNRLSEYQKSMPYETIAAIGGRVSGWKNTVLSEIPQDK